MFPHMVTGTWFPEDTSLYNQLKNFIYLIASLSKHSHYSRAQYQHLGPYRFEWLLVSRPSGKQGLVGFKESTRFGLIRNNVLISGMVHSLTNLIVRDPKICKKLDKFLLCVETSPRSFIGNHWECSGKLFDLLLNSLTAQYLKKLTYDLHHLLCDFVGISFPEPRNYGIACLR